MTSRSELVGYLGLSLSLSDTDFLLSSNLPPEHPGWEEYGEAGAWISLLPRRLQELLRSAINQEWPFLTPDMKPDWLTSPNTDLPDVSENLILLKSLLLALETKKYSLAAAVAFVLDRFMYWYGGARVILKVVSILESSGQSIPVAPQMLIRKARVLKDSGDLHGATRVLNSVMASEWNSPGTWNYKTKAQHDNVVAVCVQIEGQILHNLGLWSEAIPLLVKSIEGFENLPVRDEKGISSSLGILGKCLKQLSMGDYAALQQSYPGFVQSHPCHEAYSKAASAAQLCPPQNLFTARHYLEAGDSLLRYAVQQSEFNTRHKILGTSLARLSQSLAQHLTVKSLHSREQSYEFLKALYLASITLMFSPSARDTRLAWVVEELSIALYTTYCRNAEGLGHIKDSVQLCNVALKFLGLPKLTGPQQSEDLSERFREVQLAPRDLSSSRDSDPAGGATGTSLLGSNTPRGNPAGMGTSTENTSADDMRLAQRREVGLPADPHSLHYTNINPELVRAAHESVQAEPTCSNMAPKADPSATTLCSTYTIEALRDLQSGSDSSSSSYSGSSSSGSSSTDSSAASSTGHTVADEIEFSPPTQYRPLVDWKNVSPRERNPAPEEQPNMTGSHSEGNTQIDIQQVQQVVEDNFSNIMNKNGASRALLWQYDPLQKQWSPQSTLVYVGSLVALSEHKKGKHRDTIHIHFLHQDESLGRYVAKRYRKKNPRLGEYLQDVESQMTARYFVTLFNRRLQALPRVEQFAKIQYLPAAHLQVLTPGGQIMDYLNVEPYLEGDSEFVKLTNNYDYSNAKVSREMLETALAFTHFTHTVSQGQTMIVDLQGWLPRDTSDVLYLTDPQFNSRGDGKASPFDQKERGMDVFWSKVHPRCNQLCEALQLWRPV